MEAVKDAINAVQRNVGPLCFYLVVSLVLGELMTGVLLLEKREIIRLESPDKELGLLVLQTLMAVGYAAAQCVAFSRMGREIDRPLWKISGDREALRRFFGLWVGLHLTIVILSQLVGLLAGGESGESHPLVLVPFVGWFVVVVVGGPVCTCLMFWGKVEAGHIGEALTPLGRQFGRAFPFFLLGLVVWPLSGLMVAPEGYPASVMASAAIVYVVCGYIDCIVFAGIWLVCMTDRDTIEEPDFDF